MAQVSPLDSESNIDSISALAQVTTPDTRTHSASLALEPRSHSISDISVTKTIIATSSVDHISGQEGTNKHYTPNAVSTRVRGLGGSIRKHKCYRIGKIVLQWAALVIAITLSLRAQPKDGGPVTNASEDNEARFRLVVRILSQLADIPEIGGIGTFDSPNGALKQLTQLLTAIEGFRLGNSTGSTREGSAAKTSNSLCV